MSRAFDRLRVRVAHAFATKSPDDAITAEDEALADDLARFLVVRKLAAPALVTLEAGRPYNFLASQALVFLTPFARVLFTPERHARFTRFLEKRDSIDCLIRKIEDAERESR